MGARSRIRGRRNIVAGRNVVIIHIRGCSWCLLIAAAVIVAQCAIITR